MEAAIQTMFRVCGWVLMACVFLAVLWAILGVDKPKRFESRGNGWQRVRALHLELYPACEACGSIESLNVHHIASVRDRPDLELEPSNLMTFCRAHHFAVGHDPDGIDGPLRPNWSRVNPRAKEDAAKWKARIGK
jgi:5-methylcytosine-specific restriction endonuclease McrA